MYRKVRISTVTETKRASPLARGWREQIPIRFDPSTRQAEKTNRLDLIIELAHSSLEKELAHFTPEPIKWPHYSKHGKCENKGICHFFSHINNIFSRNGAPLHTRMWRANYQNLVIGRLVTQELVRGVVRVVGDASPGRLRTRRKLHRLPVNSQRLSVVPTQVVVRPRLVPPGMLYC